MNPKVAVVCAYRDHDTNIVELCEHFKSYTPHVVLWAVDNPLPGLVGECTKGQGKGGKFANLNRLLPEYVDFDHVVFSDDDIKLQEDFLSRYIDAVDLLGAEVAQASLEQSPFQAPHMRAQPVFARVLDTVAIGPVFSLHGRGLELLVPFPEHPPMGWGFESLWRRVIAENNLKTYVIDYARVLHFTRGLFVHYSSHQEEHEMHIFLQQNNLPWPHVNEISQISNEEAQTLRAQKAINTQSVPDVPG